MPFLPGFLPPPTRRWRILEATPPAPPITSAALGDAWQCARRRGGYEPVGATRAEGELKALSNEDEVPS